MANCWLAFSTGASVKNGVPAKWASGDFMLIYRKPPGATLTNKLYAWFGPVDLTDEEYDDLLKRAHCGSKFEPDVLDKAMIELHDAAYLAKAFDPLQTVDVKDIPVIAKSELLLAICSKTELAAKENV